MKEYLPVRCPACHFRTNTAAPGTLCPLCRKSNRYVAMIEDKPPTYPGGTKPLAAISAQTHPRLRIPGYPSIERAMGGGFVPGSLTLLYGPPGLGKSRLALALADSIASVDRVGRPLKDGTTKDKFVLYITTEINEGQVALYSKRMALLGTTLIAYQPDHRDLLNVFWVVRPVFCVIDSFHGIMKRVSDEDLMLDLRDAMRRENTACLLVGWETQDGGVYGGRAVEHHVDAVVRLEPMIAMWTGKEPPPEGFVPERRLRWSVIQKYRFGPIGQTAELIEREGRIVDADQVTSAR